MRASSKTRQPTLRVNDGHALESMSEFMRQTWFELIQLASRFLGMVAFRSRKHGQPKPVLPQ